MWPFRVLHRRSPSTTVQDHPDPLLFLQQRQRWLFKSWSCDAKTGMLMLSWTQWPWPQRVFMPSGTNCCYSLCRVSTASGTKPAVYVEFKRSNCEICVSVFNSYHTFVPWHFLPKNFSLINNTKVKKWNQEKQKLKRGRATNLYFHVSPPSISSSWGRSCHFWFSHK